jgi:hypothetical protein
MDNEGTEAYSADCLPQQSWSMLREQLLLNIYSLVEAVRAGKTAAQWADAEMSNKEGEESLLLYHFFQDAFLTHARSMYQCVVCHRIYIETQKRNEFRSFAPESDDSQAILESGDAPA